jgi:hypothetical protein
VRESLRTSVVTALATRKRLPRYPEFSHAQFPAMNLARDFRLKASVGPRRKSAHQGDAADAYRRTLLSLSDAEMAEQVVSDEIVRACMRPVAPGRVRLV